MVSVMASFWALDPSADSFPAGQARPEALDDELSEAPLPGSPVLGGTGSEPQAARVRAASAARAASLAAR